MRKDLQAAATPPGTRRLPGTPLPVPASEQRFRGVPTRSRPAVLGRTLRRNLRRPDPSPAEHRRGRFLPFGQAAPPRPPGCPTAPVPSRSAVPNMPPASASAPHPPKPEAVFSVSFPHCAPCPSFLQPPFPAHFPAKSSLLYCPTRSQNTGVITVQPCPREAGALKKPDGIRP